MIHAIKETLNVGVNHPATAFALDACPYPFTRLHRVPAWTEPKRDVEKVRLEQRLDHDSHRRLHHAVPKRRHSQWTLTALTLGNHHPPHGLSLIPVLAELLRNLREPGVDAVGFDGLDSETVAPGCAVVLLYLGPCTLKDVLAVNLVIQRVEPPCSLPLGRTIQRPLESASRITRVLSPSRHSRTPPPSSASVKQGPFPPAELCCPGAHRYYSPLRHALRLTPTSRGSPVIRHHLPP
jgi:hypothetical protein